MKKPSLIVRILGKRNEEDEEELADIENEKREMMRGIAQLSETTVKEIMVPRIDVVSLSIDTSLSSTLPDVRCRAPETAQVALDGKETLKLHVFLDRSVVEVFVNGRQCVAVRVYPGREDSVGVSLRAQGTDATLKSLDAWQMKSIYE